MFNRSVFILAHQANDINFNKYYNFLITNQWRSRHELEKDQVKQIKNIVKFAYDNVPYYHRTFKSIHLSPDDITSLKDMKKIPVLTKDIIRNNYHDLKPVNIDKIKYLTRATGGSTGTPLQYRLDKKERFFMAAMMYRGWGYGGYELGDRTLFFGGSSIGTSAKSGAVKKINERVRNIRMVSSFSMEDSILKKYVDLINKFRPKFIYGYPSSINLLATYIDKNNVQVHNPDGIFSTSENLFSKVRHNIENTFDTQVYNTYGLNDGGVTAFECSEHSGLHTDTERSCMEVVDDDSNQLSEGVGKILATSLGNYSMPFIRYDTGDFGDIADDDCQCGRHYRMLRDIVGRSVDILITPDGKKVHGWLFLYIFWEYGKGIKNYQVVQRSIDKICIYIVPDDDFDEIQLEKVREIVNQRVSNWEIEFHYVDRIKFTSSGKNKFIINELIN